jgi:hypothetical protein
MDSTDTIVMTLLGIGRSGVRITAGTQHFPKLTWVITTRGVEEKTKHVVKVYKYNKT